MDKNKLLALAPVLLCVACGPNSSDKPAIPSANLGNANGQAVHMYTLTNKNGFEARIMDYGATLVSLKVPDKNGALEDIVQGFDSLDGYTQTRLHRTSGQPSAATAIASAEPSSLLKARCIRWTRTTA